MPAHLFRPSIARRITRAGHAALHQTIGIGKGEPAGLGGTQLHYGLELARAATWSPFRIIRRLATTYDFQKSKYISGSMKGSSTTCGVDPLQSP